MAISKDEIANFKLAYPDFIVESGVNGSTILIGNLIVNKTACGFTVRESFNIKVVIPLQYPFIPPDVWETEGKLEQTYSHLNSDRSLCVGTYADILFQCNGVIELQYFIQHYVISYFFSYRYYQRFGEYPFGERMHGTFGILETYKELFGVDNELTTFQMMQHIASHKYRDYLNCPCGSSKLIRHCHKTIMLQIKKHKQLKILIKIDFESIQNKFKAGNQHESDK